MVVSFHPPVSSSATTPEVQAILQAVGEQLRQARVDQGLSLADLAQRLKIGQEQLTALETGDASRLPEPVFVIARIRRVAAVLGVNADAAIHALRQQGSLLPTSPSAPGPEAGRRRPFPWLPLLLAVVLVPGLGWLTLRGWQQLQSSPRPVVSATPTAPSPPPPPKPAQPEPVGTSLTLSSQSPTWLAVRDSKGRFLFEGTFSGQRRFPLGQGLDVLAGSPDLVQVRLGDAQAKPLGPIDAVRWHRFTPPQP